MFTGIVEETGKVLSVKSKGDGKVFTISAKRVMEDLKVEDSIAVDGVCQTVFELAENSFSVFAMSETLKKTTLKNLKTGDIVNLERALTLSTRLGGHLVQGHVDCVGKVESIVKRSQTYLMDIRISPDFEKFAVLHGSIAINGVSLTIARKSGTLITVSLIPYTLENTSLKSLKRGSFVNIETDIVGKYLYQFYKKDKSFGKFSE